MCLDYPQALLALTCCPWNRPLRTRGLESAYQKPLSFSPLLRSLQPPCLSGPSSQRCPFPHLADEGRLTHKPVHGFLFPVTKPQPRGFDGAVSSDTLWLVSIQAGLLRDTISALLSSSWGQTWGVSQKTAQKERLGSVSPLPTMGSFKSASELT